MQPPGKFYDYNFRSESTDPTTQTFLGKHLPGQKFVIPAEYDIFIEVNPYKLNSNTENQESEDGKGEDTKGEPSGCTKQETESKSTDPLGV